MILAEGLKINRMSKSSRNATDSPGRNVWAKSALNRSILDQGWFEFKRQLNCKLEWRGRVYVAVNPSYSSQKYSSCLNISKKSSKSRSKFSCISCGHRENAEINAAKNILATGHVVLTCGENALVFSMKQEPLNMGNLVSG